MADNVAAWLRLMLVTDDALVEGRDLVALARAAEQAGITVLQLRLKRRSPRDQAGLARALVAALRIPVLVNDRPDVALASGAAGVHLGPDDLPIALVRRIAPPGFLIGASVGSPEEAGPAAAADYWGVGPWRHSPSKGDAGESLGPAGFRRLVQISGGRPCLAIGGVVPRDIEEVRAWGGAGVAVASGILRELDIGAAARRYAEAVSKVWP